MATVAAKAAMIAGTEMNILWDVSLPTGSEHSGNIRQVWFANLGGRTLSSRFKTTFCFSSSSSRFAVAVALRLLLI
jgi:hypothetical protein